MHQHVRGTKQDSSKLCFQYEEGLVNLRPPCGVKSHMAELRVQPSVCHSFGAYFGLCFGSEDAKLCGKKKLCIKGKQDLVKFKIDKIIDIFLFKYKGTHTSIGPSMIYLSIYPSNDRPIYSTATTKPSARRR